MARVRNGPSNPRYTMTGSALPPIWADAVRKALTTDAAGDSRRRAAAETAELDAQELHDLERAEYYGQTEPPPAKRRGFLDRLFGR